MLSCGRLASSWQIELECHERLQARHARTDVEVRGSDMCLCRANVCQMIFHQLVAARHKRTQARQASTDMRGSRLSKGTTSQNMCFPMPQWGVCVRRVMVGQLAQHTPAFCSHFLHITLVSTCHSLSTLQCGICLERVIENQPVHAHRHDITLDYGCQGNNQIYGLPCSAASAWSGSWRSSPCRRASSACWPASTPSASAASAAGAAPTTLRALPLTWRASLSICSPSLRSFESSQNYANAFDPAPMLDCCTVFPDLWLTPKGALHI